MDNKKVEEIEEVVRKNISEEKTIDFNRISDKNLKSIILDRVKEANYINEEWQLSYAVERILKKVRYNGTKTKNGLAITSLVLSLISTVSLFQIISIVAVIFGHLSLIKIKKYPDIYTGKNMAIAGLIIGYLVIIVGIFTGIMKGLVKLKLGL